MLAQARLPMTPKYQVRTLHLPCHLLPPSLPIAAIFAAAPYALGTEGQLCSHALKL